MKLRGSAPSPYTRKVRIVAELKGLSKTIEIEDANTADPNDSLRQQNPLGKIPALVLADGQVLFDSRVIAEYLDSVGEGQTLFPAGAARWPALALQALADGICDAALLQVYEQRFRPQAQQNADWTDMQAAKVSRALAQLEATMDGPADNITIGEIALAAALGYLDFRFAGTWRTTHPRLVD
ncbi:MAG: glutathione S-transferase N-terminal domain-containing protein, partial [Hyphomicrobiales bacterium]